MTGRIAFCCAMMSSQWAMTAWTDSAAACQPVNPRAAYVTEKTAHVSFAAGAVELPFDPRKWTVAEVPAGRQILLAFTRDRSVPQRRQEMTDGVWIAYTHAPSATGGDQTLRKRLAARFAWAAAGDASTSGPVRSHTIDGRPARLQHFSRIAPSGGDGAARVQGFHLVARMASGWLDVHFTAPDSLADARRADAMDLLEAMQLASPRLAPTNLSQDLAEAAPVVGSWKSPGALLSFSPDGVATLRPDRESIFPLNELGRLQFDNPVPELTGTYRPRGDVLAITWQDGSRLNVRWRVENGELFLTDHEGRVRQLGRVFR